MTSKRSIWPKLLLYLFLVGLIVLAVVNRQNIYDWYRLRGYQAPAAITALAEQTTMTPKAKHLLYINHPEVQDRAAFNTSCPNNGGEQTIILGCYHDVQRGIYVFNVTDPQLDGVEQVTLAHETLHAAYSRLSSSERRTLDAQLQDFYVNGLADQRIKDTIDAYKKTEPNDLVNEMHSIFGTEVANLPAPLEAHYKQYFSSRATVVAFAANYQGAFTSRKAKIAEYDAQLQTLKVAIDSGQAGLDAQANAIDDQRQQMDSLRSGGQAAAYNAQVDSFNAQIRDYNAKVAIIRGKIDQFNAIVIARNNLATEEQNLAQKLNSQPQTQSIK
jgi:hypothetical protein